MPPITPHQFVARWRAATVTERAASQSHFNDLCDLLGVVPPIAADPHGEWFAFEKNATKATGGQGWADVWKRDCFGWEYKGKHADLGKAYAQLLQYQGQLGNPPLLIVSDIDTIIIHRHFTGYVDAAITLTLDDLLDPAKLDLLRKAFTDPTALRPGLTTEQVTRAAAEKFGAIARRMSDYGHESQAVAHFLIRLLFCLFAEDVGILPPKLFSRLLTAPGQNAARLQGQLRYLFAAMAEGGTFGEHTIRHIDGGLFNDDAALLMDGDSLRDLAQISGQDWGAIEPAIFGTLFERGLNPDKRSQQGAHYTSKDDILLVVEPVLMAPLRREWAAVRGEAEQLANQLSRIDAEDLTDKRPAVLRSRRDRRDKLQARISEKLSAFRQRLASVQVLDPACGSGNFLYVSLRLLLDLEKEVSAFEAAAGGTFAFPTVTTGQLHGIELDPYAQELAQATIWIGYLQWWLDNGYGLPPEPILKPLDAIRRMDAVLAHDASGRPVEPEWPAADVIVGNPPFLGVSKQRSELGEEYMKGLDAVYGDRLPVVDFVCYWFEKARSQIVSGNAKRAGLLATNSIRGGANRKVLERIKEDLNIFWAQSNRDWVLDGAAVNVSMVGFGILDGDCCELDGKPVTEIYPDLTTTLNLTRAVRLTENFGISYSGTKKGGSFEVTQEQALVFLSDKGNPNGRPNSDVVKPWLNGLAIVGRDTHLSIIDFGTNANEYEASLYEKPFEYVRAKVQPERLKNNRERRRLYWWLHSEVAPGMRDAIRGLKRYIATPRIAKHRIFIWVSAKTIPDDGVYIFAREDDYFFGVLHSHPHALWALRLGTSLEDRPRYTATTTFETYPFPYPPGQEPADDPRVADIASAAADLVAKRDAWLNPPDADPATLATRTLTRLYNEPPTWLRLAHARLDRAVHAAYGWPPDLPDDEILARLLALNAARAC